MPPRSPTIVGSAVETIVWSRAARSRTSISAAEDGAHAGLRLEDGVRHLGDTTNKMKLLRYVTITR